jgi:chaperonin GroES
MASKTNIKPMFDYVLIKPLEREEVTASGILLPDTVKEKPQMGEIMAVGEGFGSEDGRENKIIVKVGQKVIYKKWGGEEVKVDGKEWLLVEQKSIMAVVA